MVDHIGGVNGAMGNVPARNIKKTYNYQNLNNVQVNDKVELSGEVMTVRGAEKPKLDRIMEIRQQIKDGTYLTDEKLDKALDSAIDDALKSF